MTPSDEVNPHFTDLLQGGDESEEGAQQGRVVIGFGDFNLLGLSSAHGSL